jgi:predicted transcriptional regulator
MARRRSVPLTEVEQRLMEIVWASGPATVGQIVDAIRETERPAYNTVQTMMKILERKGYVRHRAVGRAFVYESIVDRDAAARTALSQVVQRFFGGSPQALAVNLIEGDHLTEDELDELQRTIARAKDES